MLTFVFLWVAFSFAIGMLAKQRGRSLWSWTLICLVISPLLGFVIIMMMKDLALADALDTVTHDLELTHVKCVHCAEYIAPEASVCPYCRNAVKPQPEFVKRRLEEKVKEQEEIQAGKQGNFLIGIGIVVGISILAWLSTFIK